MDSVGAELEKPASTISPFVVDSNLDVALRASSAQYDAPEQINRIRAKMETAQADDRGQHFAPPAQQAKCGLLNKARSSL